MSVHVPFSKLMASFSTKNLLEVAEVHWANLPALLGNYDCAPKTTDLDSVFGEVCRRLEVFESENATLRAAVAEMEMMLPVLEDLRKYRGLNITDLPQEALNAYRQTLENALNVIK
jgi:hypothetical protein